MHRLFVALRPPPEIRDALADVMDGVPGARWQDDDHEVEAWLARHAGLTSGLFAFRHLILYESHLGRHGASYEPIARWPLG